MTDSPAGGPVGAPIAMHALTATAHLGQADEPAQGSSWVSLAFLPLMIVVFYFLVIRPNSRKRKEAMALQAALQVGDEVVTVSGIYGKITGEDGPGIFWLEIDDDVQVRIGRGYIQGRVTESTGSATDEAAADTTTSSSDDD